MSCALAGVAGCNDDATAASADETTGSADGPGTSASESSGTPPGTTDGPADTTAGPGSEASSGPTPPDLPPEPAPVTINEVMPDNDSTLNGPDGYSTPDWVELVNTSAEAVALSRIGLRNGANESWTGTDADGEIAPGEHLLVWLGAPQGDDGGIWTGWSVEREYDGLVLVFDGHDAEQVAWAVLGDDVSSMRLPDTTGEFVSTAWPTPAEVNLDVASPTLDSAEETVFLTDTVHRIDFVLSPEISATLDQPDRPEVHIEAMIDGIRFADVGLKLKGSASYDTMDGKPGFVVDMNQWLPGTEFRGLTAFKLHNGAVIDPTRARDHITYALARDVGLMAPRVGWAEVYFSDEYYGIYMIIERHDDTMIEARRPGAGELGMIFEPTVGWENDFGSQMSWDYEDGPDPLPAEATATLNAIDDLVSGPATDQAVAQLWNYMDQDKLWAYMAWESVVSHYDGYKAPNNWRVYVDGTTFKAEFAPSGAEWTWDFDVDIWWYGGRVAWWCTQNTTCAHGYGAKILEVADRVDAMGLLAEFEAQSEFLAPYIAIDPRFPIYDENSYWYPYGTFDYAYPSTIEHLTNNPIAAREAVYAAFPDLIP